MRGLIVPCGCCDSTSKAALKCCSALLCCTSSQADVSRCIVWIQASDFSSFIGVLPFAPAGGDCGGARAHGAGFSQGPQHVACHIAGAVARCQPGLSGRQDLTALAPLPSADMFSAGGWAQAASALSVAPRARSGCVSQTSVAVES